MVLVIHGNRFSTSTARVTLCFLAMGLEVDRDFKLTENDWQVLKDPKWVAQQPFGQVPYLEDTEAGTEVFQSRAIIAYVAAKVKSPLAPGPDDLAAYGKYQQGAQTEVSQFDHPAGVLSEELFFHKWMGKDTNDANVAANKAGLAFVLEGYDRLLSKQKYIGGDRLTVADLCHIPYGAVLEMLGSAAAPQLTDGSLPNVKRWWDEIKVHSAWAKTKGLGINRYEDADDA